MDSIVTIDRNDNNTSITANNGSSLVDDLIYAAKTVKDDPGNYKKKALLSTAASVAGGIALTRLKMKHNINSLANSTEIGDSLVQRLTTAAIPAGIYYAIQNYPDRPANAMAGSAAAAGSFAYIQAQNRKGNLDPEVFEAVPEQKSFLGASAATALPALYAVHQLENMKREEALRNLKVNTTLTTQQKEEELDKIKNKKDMYARYPASRFLPFSSDIRSVYNNFLTVL